MPSENEIYGALSLFGIGISIQGDDPELMAAVLAMFADKHRVNDPSIYVVLRAYGVNHAQGSRHEIRDSVLTIVRDGIVLVADGPRGRGHCDIPKGSPDHLVRELFQTLVLFLVAHAGRIPLHASAILMGDIALVMAGPSGSGKSSLALAADRAGLAVLSEDTVFVQMAPRLKLWSFASPIHVLAPDQSRLPGGDYVLRGGRLKQALPMSRPQRCADRAELILLRRGGGVGLHAANLDDAIRHMTRHREAGFDLFGENMLAAIRAIGAAGVWELRLSEDPAEAIDLLCRTFSAGVP